MGFFIEETGGFGISGRWCFRRKKEGGWEEEGTFFSGFKVGILYRRGRLSGDVFSCLISWGSGWECVCVCGMCLCDVMFVVCVCMMRCVCLCDVCVDSVWYLFVVCV